MQKVLSNNLRIICFLITLFFVACTPKTAEIVESAEIMEAVDAIKALEKTETLKSFTAYNDDEDTFKPLVNGKAPQTMEELWADFNPRKEPLEVEILKAWEEDGVVMQVLRYRVGRFKGEKAMLAAIYGYPKGATNLPGLLQIHGGGQYADYRPVLANAKRGYATISISWAGRINAPDYKVTPKEVVMYWKNKTDDPNYKVTTDWGPLDAYHAPSRNPKHVFVTNTKPAPWTLDAVESPRNNGWFLATVGARRALTFLEQQPQVNKDKLGVYGHSMGGRLTVLTAGSDDRLKAAAPSCGGISARHYPDLLNRTLGDQQYLKNITCPIFFLMPSNDFHGRVNDLPKAISEIKTKDWRVTTSAYQNHRDNPAFEVATMFWMDEKLKNSYVVPKSPKGELNIKTKNGVPTFSITPDASKKIVSIDIYYTQDGNPEMEITKSRDYTLYRYWKHSAPTESNGVWTGELPLLDTKKAVWVFGNVLYESGEMVEGIGYSYFPYKTDKFNLSTPMETITPEMMAENKVAATLKPTLQLENFEGDWQKEWFSHRPQSWVCSTLVVGNKYWEAPKGAKLAIDVKTSVSSSFVVRIDNHAKLYDLKAGTEWQELVLSPKDLTNAVGESLENWNGIKILSLIDITVLKENRRGPGKVLRLGQPWRGKAPEFRNLRWVVE